ncbi:MAG: hypothetical protein HC859_10290 [Bacteroidia bacterium]|nr:hypothetical protein [Bacteroidia bacterium]
MKNFFFVLLLPSLLSYHLHTNASITPADRVGFALPDSVTEFTLRYETIENLIILPVQINKDLKLNLILDTGCRNIVLFGRRFNKYFRFEPGKVVKFSGLGDGNPVEGSVALNNTVSIGAVLGERIPLVVVPSRNLFSSFTNIHGVIGYRYFLSFR